MLAPAVRAAAAAGVSIAGPFPGDTLFVRAARGEFDAVIACYHDQGLIPVKLLAFGRAVNVTLGLPIVRTSVDHGTAFDIAGQDWPTRRAWSRRCCWRPGSRQNRNRAWLGSGVVARARATTPTPTSPSYEADGSMIE